MKTRTEIKQRMVHKTIDGRTYEVPGETYAEEVPVLPRDMDAIALNAVIGAVAVILAGAVIWSTISIGSLLSTAAPAWAAYMVAGVFDLSWIICMTLEWLNRYDQARAALPRMAGWAALAVSMVMISLHGYEAGSLVGGIAGAVVSALAKGLWTFLMKHLDLPMDAATRGWVEKDLAEANALMAVAGARRRAGQVRERSLGYSAALALETVDKTTDWTVSQDTTEPVRPVVSVPASSVRPSVTVSLPVRPSVSSRVRDMVKSGMDNHDIRSSIRDEFPDATEANISKSITRARSKHSA